MSSAFSSMHHKVRRLLLWLLLASGLMLTNTALADTRSDSVTGSDIGRIIHLSGVMGISDQVRQLALSDDQTDQEQRRHLRTLVGWAPVALEQRYQNVLNGYSEAELATLLDLLQSPLMQRARDAEALALSEQDSAAYEAYMERLQEQPPAKARRQRIELILNRNGMWQWMLKARASVPTSEAIAEPEQIRLLAEHFLLYAYRGMDNHSLDELNRLWAQPALQRWLNDAYHALPSSDTVYEQKSPDSDQVSTSD